LPIGKSGCGLGVGDLYKFWGSPIFLQRLKLATSKLACGCGLPRPIIKSHTEKSGRDPGLKKLPKMLGFPCKICATAEASNFKFGLQLGFAKAHHKNTQKKVGLALSQERFQILGVPL